jgi:hypothetical protein
VNDNQSYFAKLRSEETEILENGTEVAVWYAIKSYAGNQNHICYASERQIANRARVAQDTVGRIRNELVAKGLIENLGKKKAPNAKWATYHLLVKWNDNRSDVNENSSLVNDSSSNVNDGAEQVNDSKELKHKGNIAAAVAGVAISSSKQQAWDNFSSAYLIELGISDPRFIETTRQAYLNRAKLATINAVRMFIDKQLELTPPDLADHKKELWPEDMEVING